MYEENNSSSKGIWIALVAALVVAAAIACGLELKKIQKREASAREVLTEAPVAADEVNILGNYMIRMENGTDEVSRITGYIDVDAMGGYVLYMLNEYGQQAYPLTFCEDGTIFNADLGEGKMSFRKNVNKTSIRFQKDANICTLIK